MQRAAQWRAFALEHVDPQGPVRPHADQQAQRRSRRLLCRRGRPAQKHWAGTARRQHPAGKGQRFTHEAAHEAEHPRPADREALAQLLPFYDNGTLATGERARIEAVIPKGMRVVALDERGTAVTTMALADKPETINEDAYGEGWLFVVELSEPDQLNELLSPDDYAQLLEDEGH